VPGLLRASLPNIYTSLYISQRLVPHFQWAVRISEPLPVSGIDENKAGWRPSQRTLTFKGCTLKE